MLLESNHAKKVLKNPQVIQNINANSTVRGSQQPTTGAFNTAKNTAHANVGTPNATASIGNNQNRDQYIKIQDNATNRVSTRSSVAQREKRSSRNFKIQ